MPPPQDPNQPIPGVGPLQPPAVQKPMPEVNYMDLNKVYGRPGQQLANVANVAHAVWNPAEFTPVNAPDMGLREMVQAPIKGVQSLWNATTLPLYYAYHALGAQTPPSVPPVGEQWKAAKNVALIMALRKGLEAIPPLQEEEGETEELKAVKSGLHHGTMEAARAGGTITGEVSEDQKKRRSQQGMEP